MTNMPTEVASALAVLGAEAYALGKLPEAEAAYRRALEMQTALLDAGRTELAPDCATSWNNLGVVLLDQQRLLEAEAAYRRALEMRTALLDAGRTELAPNCATSWSNLGNVLFASGLPRDASDAYESGAKLLWNVVAQSHRYQYEPALVEALLRVANVKIALQEFAQAENAIWDAVRAAPHVKNLFDRGIAVYRTMLMQSDAALADGGLPRDEVLEGMYALLKKLAPYQHDGAQAMIARARHREVMGDVDAAQKDFEAAAQQFGESTPAVFAHFADFLINISQFDSSWSVVERGLGALERYLRTNAARIALRPSTDVTDHLQTLLLITDRGLSAIQNSPQLHRHPGQQAARRFALSRALGESLRWQSSISDPLFDQLVRARRAADSGAMEAIEAAERQQLLYERVLHTTLGDRWPRVQERLQELAADGELDTDELSARAAQIERALLLESAELRNADDRVRSELRALFGSDPRELLGAHVFDHLLIALEAPRVLGSLGAAPAAAAKTGLHQFGAAVEAALVDVVFSPYRAAVESGKAKPIVNAPPIQRYLQSGEASHLRLGTMATPWGRLGKHWKEPRPDIAPLAEWLSQTESRFVSGRIEDARLYVLADGRPLIDRIGDLRNRGAHGAAAVDAPTFADLDDLRSLVLGEPGGTEDDSVGFLPRLYASHARS